MEFEFTVKGRRYRISREKVEKALEGVEPEIVWDLAVWVNDQWYPVKQALVAPFDDLTHRAINSRFAWRVLRKTGLVLHDKKVDGPLPETPGRAAADAESKTFALGCAAQVFRGSSAPAADVVAMAEAFGEWLAA